MKYPPINWIWKRSGKLEVIWSTQIKLLCKCDCGNIKEIYKSNLEFTRSCWCLVAANFEDIVDKKIGMLKVIKYIWWPKKLYYCICDCWNYRYVNRGSLWSGQAKSCWCLRNKDKISHWLTRFDKRDRFFTIWQWMVMRCNNTKSKTYERYWLEWIKLLWNNIEEFKEDMYESYLEHVKVYWEKQTTIDRFPDQKGNYCKDNCRWATIKEQNNNRKNVIKIWNETITDIAKRLNKTYGQIRYRYKLWIL